MELVDTHILYKDQVLPNQRNGIYGHGRERYDAVLEVFEEELGGPHRLRSDGAGDPVCCRLNDV